MSIKPRASLTSDQQKIFNDLVLEGLAQQDTQMMKLALDNGASGRTLDIVLDAGPAKYSVDMMKFALTHGANPNILVFTGIRHKRFNWKDGDFDYGMEIVKLAVEHHADVNARMRGIKEYPKESTSGEPAIHWALFHDKMDILDYLIKNGASVDSVDSHGDTPLMNAIIFGMPERAAHLLNQGADPLYRCASGGFPLQALQSSDKFTEDKKIWLSKMMMIKTKPVPEKEPAPEPVKLAEEKSQAPLAGNVLDFNKPAAVRKREPEPEIETEPPPVEPPKPSKPPAWRKFLIE